MCDDRTEAENEVYFQTLQLNRREVTIGAGMLAAAALTGCATTSFSEQGSTPKKPETPAGRVGTTGRIVTIDTPDGSADGFFVSPKSGPRPGVLIWPDVAGLRPAFETMATRLAAAGYAVLAVNPYYRSSKLPVLTDFAQWRTEEGKAKIAPMRAALTPDRIASDGATFIDWLDQQPEVDPKRKLATTGYCMGGPFTFRAAAARPERVGAIGSFHGGGLAADDATSPHLLVGKMKAAALICIAQNDDDREPKAKTILTEAARAANLSAEIEVYPAQHGWCVIDSPVYDEPQAERAWARMLATFEQSL